MILMTNFSTSKYMQIRIILKRLQFFRSL